MQDFAKTYSAMTDDQLLNVYVDIETLIPAAQASLLSEMQRRNLGEFASTTSGQETPTPSVESMEALPIPEPVMPNRSPREHLPRKSGTSPTDKLAERYNEAYSVAKALVLIGRTVKIGGIVLAVLIFIEILNELPKDLKGGPIGALLFCVFLGLMFYVMGVVVSALGQMLQASLDTAVNTSPLLDNRRRIEMISIQQTDLDEVHFT